MLPLGVCDDRDDCKKKIDDLCKKAGHGGVKPKSVELTDHKSGGTTCSGACANNGAIGFVTCDAKPNKS